MSLLVMIFSIGRTNVLIFGFEIAESVRIAKVI